MNNYFSIDSMGSFVKAQGIHLFILIGRLQSDGHLKWDEDVEHKLKCVISYK